MTREWRALWEFCAHHTVCRVLTEPKNFTTTPGTGHPYPKLEYSYDSLVISLWKSVLPCSGVWLEKVLLLLVNFPWDLSAPVSARVIWILFCPQGPAADKILSPPWTAAWHCHGTFLGTYKTSPRWHQEVSVILETTFSTMLCLTNSYWAAAYSTDNSLQ